MIKTHYNIPELTIEKHTLNSSKNIFLCTVKKVLDIDKKKSKNMFKKPLSADLYTV